MSFCKKEPTLPAFWVGGRGKPGVAGWRLKPAVGGRRRLGRVEPRL